MQAVNIEGRGAFVNISTAGRVIDGMYIFWHDILCRKCPTACGNCSIVCPVPSTVAMMGQMFNLVS